MKESVKNWRFLRRLFDWGSDFSENYSYDSRSVIWKFENHGYLKSCPDNQ